MVGSRSAHVDCLPAVLSNSQQSCPILRGTCLPLCVSHPRISTLASLGQDIFIPGRKFVISGRNVLEVDSNLSREEIEAIVHDAETEAVDQHGGWSHAGQTLPTTMFKGTDCPTAWFDPAAA